MHTQINKALAAVFGALVFLATNFGIEITPEIQDGINTVIAILTPILVYYIPNAEPKK